MLQKTLSISTDFIGWISVPWIHRRSLSKPRLYIVSPEIKSRSPQCSGYSFISRPLSKSLLKRMTRILWALMAIDYLLWSGCMPHSKVLHSVMVFQLCLAPGVSILQAAFDFNLREKSDWAPGWTRKLHHLSATTYPTQTDKWLLPGSRNGATLAVYWGRWTDTAGAHGCIKILSGKPGSGTYQPYQTMERVKLLHLDPRKWWTVTLWWHGPAPTYHLIDTWNVCLTGRNTELTVSRA